MFKRGEERKLNCNTFVAGIDVDGQLRGKFVPGHKTSGSLVPFCSVVFGWDCNDLQYNNGYGNVADPDTGYGDLDLHLDWSRQYYLPKHSRNSRNETEMVLGFFAKGGADKPLYCDPRSLLRRVLDSSDFTAKAGAEIEFYNFQNTSAEIDALPSVDQTVHLTVGMQGYSALRPVEMKSYWDAILESSSQFGIAFDTWHSESGPGVYECALKYQNADIIADQVTLFKYAVRTCSPSITPCFMAKPKSGMPGNSGHLHCSLWTADGKSVFTAKEPTNVFPETKWLSMEGHWFLAGLIEALPHIMLMFAPNVNSYKRLDPTFWAPVTVTWGSDNRLSSIRLIDCKENSKSCRFEVRIPGADLIPHFALAAIFGAGYRGIRNKTPLTLAPVRTKADIIASKPLPHTLADAIQSFEAPNSIARELFGDEFVDHYAGTRKHELDLYNKQVSDWEFKRYVGTC